MFIALASMWMLAEHLGPEIFGTLSYLLAIIALMGPIVSLGLNSIVVRELVNYPSSGIKIMSTLIALRILGAVIGSILCFIYAFYVADLSYIEKVSLVILGGASVFNGLNGFEFWFQAKVAAKVVAKMRTLVILLFALLKVWIVLADFVFFKLVIVFAAEQVVLGFGFLLIYIRDSGKFKLSSVDLSYGISIIRQSVWLVFSGIAAIVYLKIDQVMLGEMVGREAVGIYAIAVRLSEVWYFFATAIVVSVFPSLLTVRKQNFALYSKRLQTICDLLFLSSLTCAVFVSLVSPIAISLLFGGSYDESASILAVHIWAGVFVFMRALVSKWLLSEGFLKFSLISHGVGAIFNLATNYILIPKYGAIGAAYATVLSYAIASYIVFLLHPNTFPIAKIMTRSLLLPFTFGKRYWILLR